MKHKQLLTNQQRSYLVTVLKAGLLYKDLLDEFEHRFIIEVSHRYSKYRDRLKVELKQWGVLGRISVKLCLDLQEPGLKLMYQVVARCKDHFSPVGPKYSEPQQAVEVMTTMTTLEVAKDLNEPVEYLLVAEYEELPSGLVRHVRDLL